MTPEEFGAMKAHVEDHGRRLDALEAARVVHDARELAALEKMAAEATGQHKAIVAGRSMRRWDLAKIAIAGAGGLIVSKAHWIQETASHLWRALFSSKGSP